MTYQVTDSQGAAVTKIIKVTVEAKSTPVNPDKDKPDNDKDNGSVKTGDRINLLLWEMMLIGSSIILIYNLYRKKRKLLSAFTSGTRKSFFLVRGGFSHILSFLYF